MPTIQHRSMLFWLLQSALQKLETTQIFELQIALHLRLYELAKQLLHPYLQ